jgi:hypothetical protein
LPEPCSGLEPNEHGSFDDKAQAWLAHSKEGRAEARPSKTALCVCLPRVLEEHLLENLNAVAYLPELIHGN